MEGIEADYALVEIKFVKEGRETGISLVFSVGNRFALQPLTRTTKISGAMLRAKKTFASSLQISCGRHAKRHPWKSGEIARHFPTSFPTLTNFGVETLINIWCGREVAGPGIEPGTRGFSVLCSTN